MSTDWWGLRKLCMYYVTLVSAAVSRKMMLIYRLVRILVVRMSAVTFCSLWDNASVTWGRLSSEGSFNEIVLFLSMGI